MLDSRMVDTYYSYIKLDYGSGDGNSGKYLGFVRKNKIK